MEKKATGFKTAMEQASDISSIYSTENLEPQHTDGSLYYEVYGMADSGLEQSKNEDNLYMDGIYMKSFQFSHYSKGIKTFGENALFSLCGPTDKSLQRTEQVSMKMMDELDMLRETICSSEPEDAAQIISNFFAHKKHRTEKNGLAFGAVYVSESKVFALSAGGVGIYRLYKNRLQQVGGGKRNGMVFPGNMPVEIPNLFDRKKEEIFVLCSPVVNREISLDMLAEEVAAYPPEQAVRNVMDKCLTLCNGENASLMVLRVSDDIRQEKPVKKSKKTAVIIAAIALAAVLAITGIAIGSCTSKPEPEPHVGKTVSLTEHKEALENAKNAEEEKELTEAALNECKARFAPLEEAYLSERYQEIKVVDKYKQVWNDFTEEYTTVKALISKCESKLADAKKPENSGKVKALLDEVKEIVCEELPNAIEKCSEQMAKADTAEEQYKKEAAATEKANTSSGDSKKTGGSTSGGKTSSGGGSSGKTTGRTSSGGTSSGKTTGGTSSGGASSGGASGGSTSNRTSTSGGAASGLSD